MRILRYLSIFALLGAAASIGYRLAEPEWVSFRRAERSFAKEDYPAAIARYDSLRATSFPHRDRLIERLLAAHLALGDEESARKLLAETDAETAESAAVSFSLAGILAQHRMFPESAARYRRALKLEPENRIGRIYHGRVLVAEGRFKEAKEEFELALSAVNPVRAAPVPAWRRGWKRPEEKIPDWQVRWDLARVMVYMKNYPGATAEYDRILLEKPELYRAWLEKAQVYFYRGEVSAAARTADKVPLGRLDGKERIIAAEIYMVAKNYPRAEAILTAHLTFEPQDQSARLKLAEILSWMKRYEESLSHYRILVAARPKDSRLRRKYAEVLSWSGRHREAAEQLKRALGENGRESR